MSEYTPAAGSSAEKVIAELRLREPGTTLDSTQVAELCGLNRTSVTTCMRGAVNAGVLEVVKAGNAHQWRLAPPPAPDDGRLKLAHYSTGELSVSGALIEGETVTYSAEQLQELVDYVTKPRVTPSVGGAA